LIVAEILLSAEVLRLSNKAAREEREASGGGEPFRSAVEPRRLVVGGRWDTQSWTRRETCGLEIRLRVFLEEGFVVIIIVGEVEYGEEGR
jgi:hypothetical protein